MLLPSPKVQKRLETYQTYDPIEAKARKLEWKRALRRRNGIMRSVAGLAIIGAGISSYANDVEANQEIQAKASIAVQYEGPALDKANDHKGLVFIDGVGTNGADEITRNTGAAVQPVIDGQLLSVSYNNAVLESSEIAKKIITATLDRHIDTISLVGHSAGGDIAMQVQEKIHEESNLTIESIVLVSTPDGVRTLRSASQNEIERIQEVEWIPGMEYSSLFRFIGEMALRSSSYTNSTFPQNVSDFFKTATHVQTNLQNSKLPGTWLMIDQVMAIEKANLKDRYSAMEKLPDQSVRPTIIYLGTAKPGYDPVVDTHQASKNNAMYAQTAGIPFLSYDVPGAVHSRPDLNDGYIKTLADAKIEIQSSIAEQQAIASLHRVTSRYIPPSDVTH